MGTRTGARRIERGTNVIVFKKGCSWVEVGHDGLYSDKWRH